MAGIESIEGIGKVNGKKLRAAGIKGTATMLTKCCDKKGRKEVAEATGIDAKMLLEWANRADLMRVRGVGSEYSDLLEASGVDTVKELRNRKPENLHTKMAEVNAKGKRTLVRRPPSLGEVERWVAHAKTLDPVITH